MPNSTDTLGTVCVSGAVGAGKTLQQLADQCDVMHMAGGVGCSGFNSNGFMKNCVRASCGAHPGVVPSESHLISCVRTDTPASQPSTCGGGGGNDPNPYATGCTVSANRSTCNCSGVHPPFGAPLQPVPMQKDYHFPADEAAERASLPDLLLLSTVRLSFPTP